MGHELKERLFALVSIVFGIFGEFVGVITDKTYTNPSV